MIDLVLGAAAAGGAVGLAYRAYKKRQDDENEITTTGGGFNFDCNDDADDPAGRTEIAETPEQDPREEQPEDPTPDYVTEDYDGLTDIKGIGDTRAEALGRGHGISSPTDVYYASDESLIAVEGIGEYTVSQIREDIGSVEDEAAGKSDESAESDGTDDESDTSSSTDETESTSSDE